MRKGIFEITRTQQYTDSHLKSTGQDKDDCKVARGKNYGKGARNESFEKVKDDDRRKCYYCRKTGHAQSQCKTRLKDLADAEGNQ